LCNKVLIEIFINIAGIGIAYGALVNLVSNYRDKNDHVNHAVAAMVAFPVSAVYAKSNLKFLVAN